MINRKLWFTFAIFAFISHYTIAYTAYIACAAYTAYIVCTAYTACVAYTAYISYIVKLKIWTEPYIYCYCFGVLIVSATTDWRVMTIHFET